MKIYNCSIIGYGYMGEIRRKTIENSPNTKLISIYDKKFIGEENDLFKDTFENAIGKNIDIVFVCTPNKYIPDIVSSCLDMGKHVFCEKPPGRCLDDIVEMKEAEKRNPSCKLMFGFNHRYHPGVLKAKSIVDSGELGNVLNMRGLYGKSGGINFKESWRNNYEYSGGGILLDQGIHMLDLFHYFGGKFENIKSHLSNTHWSFDVEDNALVILKNKKEQLAVLHSSSTFWRHTFQLSITLDYGYLTIDGLLSKTGSYGRETLKIGKRQFENETDAVGNPSEEVIYFDKDMSWDLELESLISCISNNKNVSESNSDDAYNVMEVIEKCYKDSTLNIYSRG
jgi:predicted dehydrogenase